MLDWSDKDECLLEILVNYTDIDTYRYGAQIQWNSAWNAFDLAGWFYSPSGMLDVMACLQRLIWAFEALATPNYDYDPYYVLPYFLTYHSGGVTWQSIIEAWVYNEYEGAVPTIYTMDKMRRVAWTKPFLIPHALSPEKYEI
jgi:hypothetical protein